MLTTNINPSIVAAILRHFAAAAHFRHLATDEFRNKPWPTRLRFLVAWMRLGALSRHKYADRLRAPTSDVHR